MGQLQNNMIIAMRTRGYSDKTIKLYTSAVRSLAKHYNKTPLVLTKQEIEAFIYYLRMQKKSEATIHVYYEAIKYFYRMHSLPDRLPKISFRRQHAKLPAILSQNEMSALLDSCSSLKYKTIFSLIYSAGLRVSEAANLKMKDIDFVRKVVTVRNTKNRKDRYTLLATRMSSLLKQYCNVYHPQNYVFYSNDVLGNISIDCIQQHFKKLIQEMNIDKSVHVHTLRHCFATHLLENGTSIFHIMNLLGHSNIQTTMVYLHMESLESLHIQSPIDAFHTQYKKNVSAAQPFLFNEIETPLDYRKPNGFMSCC